MRFLLIALVSLSFAVGLRAGTYVMPPPIEIRFKMGDDPRWAETNWDDSGWEQRMFTAQTWQQNVLPTRVGPFWMRFTMAPCDLVQSTPVITGFFWPRTPPNSPINSVYLAAVFAFELYWDGTKIGQSGQVGHDRASEIPGVIDNLVMVPPTLLGPGPHEIAIRISNYHYNFPAPNFVPSIALENYADRLVYETKQPLFPLLAVGGAVLAGLLCVFLYGFMDRRRSLLILGGLSFAIALFYFLIAWRWLHADTYPWLARRYDMIAGVMAVITLLPPWLLLEHFGISRKKLWLAALLPLVALSCYVPEYHWDKVIWLSHVMLGSSLILTLWAVWRRRAGGVLVLVGVIAGLGFSSAGSRAFLGPEFMITFASLVTFLLGSVALKARSDRRRTQEALAAKARLEFELLKQHLQPHFVVNTLSALTEVLEQDPVAGVKFIDDLAVEFRSLARMSGEKLIPLARELDLCRAHLRLASVRRGTEVTLDADDADPALEVPPSICLTLIENGLVHQEVRELAGTFVVRTKRERDRVQLQFVSPGKVAPNPKRSEGGTGLKYIKACLEESFPGRWSFAQGATAQGWETMIELRTA